MMCQVNQVIDHLSNDIFCSLLIFCTIKIKRAYSFNTSISNPLKRWRKKEGQSYKFNNLLRFSFQYKHLSPKAMIILGKYLVKS